MADPAPIAADPDVLGAECTAFAVYLGATPPPAAVCAAYAEACSHVAPEPAAGPFDRWLLAFARKGGTRTRMADVYSRFFSANGILRRRLVLLLAILESTSQAYEIDSIAPCSRLGFAATMAWRALGSVILLVAGAVLFTGVRLFVGRTGARA